jgi:hypothetical protein
MTLSRVADELIADLQQESQIVDAIIRGCVEYRWALGPEEQQIAEAMIYNAFETYALERGLSLAQAEVFCERYLTTLIGVIDQIL